MLLCGIYEYLRWYSTTFDRFLTSERFSVQEDEEREDQQFGFNQHKPCHHAHATSHVACVALLSRPLACFIKLPSISVHELAKKRFEIIGVLIESCVQCVERIGCRFAQLRESLRAIVAIRWWRC